MRKGHGSGSSWTSRREWIVDPELAAHARLDPAIALWMSFVSRSVQTRRDDVATVQLRVASQREALGRSRAMTERNRSVLIDHA